MPEPATTAISTVASTVTSSLTIARFIIDIKNTPTDVKTCFDLTHRIEEDLQTLVNLRTRHEKYLLTVPDTLKRLDRILHATQDSILDACRLLEGCRREVYEGNTIPLGSKMKWVLGDSGAFSRRTANLQQQHAALNVEIISLRQLEMLKPLERIATTTFENVELLSMEKNRAQRRTSRLDKDTGQSPPFGLGILPAASPSPTQLPSSLQLPLQRDYEGNSRYARQLDPAFSTSKTEEKQSAEVDSSEEEDAESAFYEDLRRQEDERQKRLAARRRAG